MNLNMYIIRDYLNLPILDAFISAPCSKSEIETFVLYNGQQRFYTNQLYIITAEDFLKVKKKTQGQFICLGKPSAPLDKTCDIIFITESSTISMVINALSHLFKQFQLLETTMYRIVANNGTLHDLGDAVLPFLTNPISIFSAAHKNLFGLERKKERKFRFFGTEIEENAYLPDEDMEEMRFREDFIMTLDATDPSIYPADMWGYRILYYNIRIAGLYVARAMSYEFDRPLKESDWAIIKFWGDCVGYLLKGSDILEGPTHPKGFDEMLYTLINGDDVSAHQLDTTLSTYDWKPNHTYACVVLEPNIYDRKSSTISAIGANLENRLKKSAAITLEGHLVLIVNLHLAEKSYQEMQQLLSLFLRENIMKAGISAEFSNLGTLKDYYLQARSTLSLGQKLHPTYWNYIYENYAYANLLNNAINSYRLLSICPPGLKQLISYDIEHHHNFSYTLQVYLQNNCRVAECTRLLYLQRSTLLYQIKRIQEITKMDLSKVEHRQWLQFFFALLDFKQIDLRNITSLEDLNC